MSMVFRKSALGVGYEMYSLTAVPPVFSSPFVRRHEERGKPDLPPDWYVRGVLRLWKRGLTPK